MRRLPIQLTRLPSGLTVVTNAWTASRQSRSAPMMVRLTRQSAAENGVSHFLEHMAFKGTTTRSAAEIAEEVEAVGGHINAYTAHQPRPPITSRC